MCTAITHGNTVPAPCAQEAQQGNPLGLCYYHEKMRQGHITPLLDGVSVKTSNGVSIFTTTKSIKTK